MAHFAKIENNLVTQVIVVDNKDTANAEGIEVEQIGIDFCSNLLGGTWLQTSYNTHGNQHLKGVPLRGNYAGIGFIYDATNDVFYAPQPYTSWILNNTTWLWKAPIVMPTDGKKYKWNESIANWEESIL